MLEYGPILCSWTSKVDLPKTSKKSKLVAPGADKENLVPPASKPVKDDQPPAPVVRHRSSGDQTLRPKVEREHGISTKRVNPMGGYYHSMPGTMVRINGNNTTTPVKAVRECLALKTKQDPTQATLYGNGSPLSKKSGGSFQSPGKRLYAHMMQVSLTRKGTTPRVLDVYQHVSGSPLSVQASKRSSKRSSKRKSGTKSANKTVVASQTIEKTNFVPKPRHRKPGETAKQIAAASGRQFPDGVIFHMCHLIFHAALDPRSGLVSNVGKNMIVGTKHFNGMMLFWEMAIRYLAVVKGIEINMQSTAEIGADGLPISFTWVLTSGDKKLTVRLDPLLMTQPHKSMVTLADRFLKSAFSDAGFFDSPPKDQPLLMPDQGMTKRN